MMMMIMIIIIIIILNLTIWSSLLHEIPPVANVVTNVLLFDVAFFTIVKRMIDWSRFWYILIQSAAPTVLSKSI